MDDALLVRIESAFAQTRDAALCYQADSDDAHRALFTSARAELFAAMAELKGWPTEVVTLSFWLECCRQIWSSGVLGEQADPCASQALASFSKKHPCWQLVRMLSIPVSEWSERYEFDSMPFGLWGFYAYLVFDVPPTWRNPELRMKRLRFTAERARELGAAASANRGSGAVRTAVAAYLETLDARSVGNDIDTLQQVLSVRNSLLASHHGLPRPTTIPALLREGRKLRVGFVAKELGANLDGASLLPIVQGLHPDRFEISVFVTQRLNDAFEAEFSKITSLQDLPGLVAEQSSMLASAALDVVVFALQQTRAYDEIALLAMQRFAPVQWILPLGASTVGDAAADFLISYRSGVTSAPSSFLSSYAPPLVSNFREVKPEGVWQREGLGLSPDDILIWVRAESPMLCPRLVSAWIELLRRSPNTKLLVQPLDDATSFDDRAVEVLGATLDSACARAGVSDQRVVVLPSSTLDHASRVEPAVIADFAFDIDVQSHGLLALDGLTQGLPVIAWQGGAPFSAAASYLEFAGFGECIGVAVDDAVRLAAELAQSKDALAALRIAVVDRSGRLSLLSDANAAGDVFGAALERAYDAMAASGAKPHRKTSSIAWNSQLPGDGADSSSVEALLAAGQAQEALAQAERILGANPDSPTLRHLAGLAAFAAQQPQRAVGYLLEAAQCDGGNLKLWCDLAECLLATGMPKQAMEAVQSCLSIDAQHLPAILLLGRIAERVGLLDQIEDAVTVAKKLAPHDIEVDALARKVEAAIAAKAASVTTA